ncbi:MAG: hypothetical protein Q7R55_00025 [Candidatus Wildermuthbacteria bacterium]|nr:hypothetical protein [Candidatus Wildermuthbacteria bacterium]
MASNSSIPTFCNPDIFKRGKGVCVVDGRPNDVERWVKAIAKKADAKVDWHYSGGRANVLHLGKDKSRQRVLNAINELAGELKGTILSVGGPALYRNRVEDLNATDAVVREVKGQLVLDDPEAMAMSGAVSKHNCKNTLEINADRVKHFRRRLAERGMTADRAVIVLLNVDDVHGGPLADVLMPGHNWQEIRDRGEVPFARGLAMREGIQEALSTFDKDAATKLQSMAEVAVVVVDYGVAEVFAA